jgi:hypothetical protein
MDRARVKGRRAVKNGTTSSAFGAPEAADWLEGPLAHLMRRVTPQIVHREPLAKRDPNDFVTMSDIEQAVNRASSWVRRNLREWPYQHRLMHRIEGDEMLFWFERDELA